MSAIQVKHNSRLSDLINYRLKVLTQDGRVYIGELLAFDKHMNLILSDCIEERIPAKQLKGNNTNVKIEKRTLGLTILRGEHVLSTVVQDKPLLSKKERIQKTQKEEKQLKKQQNKNKSDKTQKNTTGRVTKPTASTTGGNTASRFNGSIPEQTKQFQPPPGFKRR